MSVIHQQFAVATRPFLGAVPDLPPLPDGEGWRWLGEKGSVWYRISSKEGVVWRADAVRDTDEPDGATLIL